MMAAGAYMLLLFTIITVSINGIQSQLKVSVVDVPDEIVNLLENITDVTSTLTSASANKRLEETFVQIANTLNESVTTQHRIEDILEQVASTQTQMANALTQIVDVMQSQSEQLRNVVGQLDTQNQLISLLRTEMPLDCSGLASRGLHQSGPYIIQPADGNIGSFPVYCDLHTDGGGWTVFQRRFDGSVDFYLGWDAYEAGFGNLEGEFWLGLRRIHRLTKQGVWSLRIDLEDFGGDTAYAEYTSFSVGDTASNYRLSIGDYSGTAGDSLPAARHNNQAFSTKHRDHDNCDTCVGHGNCAQGRHGAWWYDDCTHSNLNGLYLGESQISNTGMTWFHWKHHYEVLKRSEMKIRRIR